MSLHINEIELNYEPRKAILPNITQYLGEPEMSEFESAFLCGLLKNHKPRKILEVGVAAGGTTAIVLECMEMLDLDSVEVHSVDYLDYFYKDKAKKAGFLGQEAKEYINSKKVKHQFYFNDVACSFIDKIGGDIDCLILDTMHILPGEVLDFITLLPYLKDGAIVIMHDVSLNHYGSKSQIMGFATGLLLSVVKGEKYINFNNCKYPNIGAFIVNDDTRKNISDLFLSLLVNWNYMPDNNQIIDYSNFIKKHYSFELCNIFDLFLNLQKKQVEKLEEDMYIFPYDKVNKNSNIVLYAAGEVGNSFFTKLKDNNYCNIVKWVDKNYKIICSIDGFTVDSIESIRNVIYDYIVIAVIDKSVAEQIYNNLIELGVEKDKIIWSNYLTIGE